MIAFLRVVNFPQQMRRIFSANYLMNKVMDALSCYLLTLGLHSYQTSPSILTHKILSRFTMEPTSDDIPSESTPLVNATALEVGESNLDDSTNTSSPDLEAGNAFNQFEESELEKPWPATFERSISLLAGPISDTDFIEQITKSPKITPNIGARRKVRTYFK